MELETLFGVLAVVFAILSLVDDIRSAGWIAAAVICAGVGVILLGGDVNA